MKSISDRPVVFVTGGSRGIGREICITAAKAGWDVAFSYRSEREAAFDTVAAIKAAGAEGAAFQADVAHQYQVREAFAGAWDRFQRLDAVVNNAGVLPLRPVIEMDEEFLLQGFRVNVFGLFYTTAEAVRYMSTQNGHGGGVIVNLSSAASRTGGMPGGSAYCATKGAADSLTLALARELVPHGIRVNAVRPGGIETDMLDRAALQAAAAATVPLKRPGTAAEVAAVVGFLLDPASSYVHGALVDVTGGR